MGQRPRHFDSRAEKMTSQFLDFHSRKIQPVTRAQSAAGSIVQLGLVSCVRSLVADTANAPGTREDMIVGENGQVMEAGIKDSVSLSLLFVPVI